jgi:hypothetical protein
MRLLPLALTGLLACFSSRAEPLLRLEAHNLRFAPPPLVPAGLTRVRLINRDPVWHEASLLRFTDSSATLAGYLAAARAGDEYPAFALDIGGISFLAPGDSADALVALPPGRYAVICWHRDHVLQGMGAEFEVRGASPQGKPTPPAAEMALADFTIPVLAPPAGRQLLHLTNAGPSEHELAILRLQPGKSAADFLAWRAAGETGAPPARTIAGTAALRPGSEIWLDVPWEPGRYLLLCMLEDGTGRYHAELGMQRLIEIP